MRVETSKKTQQQSVSHNESAASKATAVGKTVKAKSLVADRPKPASRRSYKSAKAKAKSETVSDLKSATDATLTIQQALALSPPQLGDGIEAARDYISKVHPVIQKTERDLTELVARIGTILLAYRNSEHGAYGKWEAFLDDNFPLSKRTARNYMSVALETTPEQRAGKGITEVYEEIGVVTRPGKPAKTRFLAAMDKVVGQASSEREAVHKIAEAFESAVSPYNGSNRDIGAFIHEYANQIRTEMTQIREATTLVSESVQTIAAAAAPNGATFHAEGLGEVRKHANWSEFPEGSTIDDKQPEEMTCCDREAVMASINKSSGACRECGLKVTK